MTINETVASDASYSNPYDDPTFLAPSDAPGMELSNTKFSGTNFISWSRCVVMALGTKNKQGFLTGAVAMPALTSPKLQQWLRSDNMVRCWYGQSNAPLLFQLKKDLKKISQGNDSVAEYFTKLKRFWDDIDELEVIPECNCGAMSKCSCNLYKKLFDMAQMEKVMSFLMGLSDIYEYPRSNMLAMDSIPPLNKVYSIIQQIESQKMLSNIVNSSQDNNAMHASKSSGKTPWNVWKRADKDKDDAKTKVDDRWCHHCKKKGHLPDACFVKYPELKAKYMARFSNANGAFSGYMPGGSGFNQKSSAFQYGQSSHPQFAQGQSSGQFVQGQATFQNQNQQGFAANSYNQQGFTQQGFGAQQSQPAQQVQFHPVMLTALYNHMMQVAQAKDESPIDLSDASVNFTGITLASNKACDACYDAWIIDSGATDHMTGHKQYYDNLNLLKKPVLIGLLDGSSQLVTHGGSITLESGIKLHDALYDPASSIPNNTSCNCSSTVHCNKVPDLDTLHARLGHTSLSKMQHIDSIHCKHLKQYQCETCLQAKIHRLPFPRSNSRAACKFELIHVDLWGPYKVATITGAHYFFTIVDDHTRVTWTFLLKYKTQVASTFENFLAQVGNVYNSSVKVVRSDNGTEIIQDTCLGMLAKRGILHQKSVPGVPQQNGRVERKHKHLVETARAMLLYAKLPKRFWGESILTATYLINKLPSPVLGWKSPYEVLMGKLPTYEELRVFGCLCYAPINASHKDKFASKGRRCLFIGYPFGQKAYKLFDLDTKKVIISRDVIFLENKFPFHNSVSNTDNISIPADFAANTDEPVHQHSPDPPREPHYQAALHVVRYLKGTVDAALFYPANNIMQMKAYCDADWGSCSFSCKSLTGHCVFLGDSLVSWKTKKQKTVSKSSAESEYRAMSYTASKIVWVQALLQDFGVHVPKPIQLNCDNKAAQHIAANPVFHERTKHINIDCHYIRERIQEGLICTNHVKSSLQLADLMTNPLGAQQHHFLSCKLGMHFTSAHALPT
ncbi:uncharacterized protein LOC141608519 [Silene latifolia]|uniref:uncharacterized protein LOC141608519 n=1 Tax=Silene latifolia TaxID=37657 RepID=UPI003D7771FE